MGGKNDAEYYRRRRAQQRQQLAEAGTPLRDYGDFALSGAFVERGKELTAMMDAPIYDVFDQTRMLPWPKSLYSDDPATIKELMAQPALQQRVPMNGDRLCKCGCGKEHRGNVTMTVRSPFGNGFNVHYFFLEACKARYIRLNGRK